MDAPLVVMLLGGLHITHHAVPVTAFHSNKAPALLAYLALSGRAHTRSALAGLLWSDLPDVDARRNLRVVLANLRRLLGAYLVITRDTIAFNRAMPYWLDVEQFEAALDAHAVADLAHLEAAVAWYRGDFLDGIAVREAPIFEEWVVAQRARLHQRARHALHALAAAAIAQHAYATSIDAATRLVAIDPWNEDAHRQLIAALAASGQRSAALEHYARCVCMLAKEFGATPSAETTALIARIQADDGPAPIVSATPLAGTHALPEIGTLYGRHREQTALTGWLLDNRCQLIALVGIGGVGKTALAVHLARQHAGRFAQVIWYSLLNAPPLDVVLRECLHRLAGPQPAMQRDQLEALIAAVLHQLQHQRCLIVFDNVESILQSQERAGHYRPAYADYGRFLQLAAQQPHQSCLLLTSRECPFDLLRLVRDAGAVRVFSLAGVAPDAGRAILHARGLRGSAEQEQALVARYSGNPLALKLVAETIQDLFTGDTATFLGTETLIFDDIRDVLDQQFARLSALEQALLMWLAIEREPVAVATLQHSLVQAESQRAVLEAVRSLQRRSLLEHDGRGVMLQNVILEYMTDRLVTAICDELAHDYFALITAYPLMQAQANEATRQTQVRLLLQPVARWLVAHFGKEHLLLKVRQWLDMLRATPRAPGYAGGNILNLLIALGDEVRGFDFSQLHVWQAYARGARLPDVSLAHSDLAGSVFTDNFRSVHALIFHPDGQHLVAGSGNGAIALWQIATAQLAAVYHRHQGFVWSLAASPDGATFASAGQDHHVRMWDAASGMERMVLHGHTQGVSAVAYHPHAPLLASAGDDRVVRVWDLASGQAVAVLPGHQAEVAALAFSADGTLLASAGMDRTVRVWDVAREQTQHVLVGHVGAVRAVAFSPDGTLISGGRDRTLRLWNAQSGMVHQILYSSDWIETLAINPAGTVIASGGRDGSVRLWDLARGQPLRDITGHASWVHAVTFDATGQHLASVGSDDAICVWDVQTGAPVTVLRGHTNVVYGVAFSADGRTLVSGTHNHLVTLWDVKQRRVRKTLAGHTGWVLAVATSPDGVLVASAGDDRTIRLWNAQTGQGVRVLHEPATIEALAFSADGTMLISANRDATIRLWAVQRGTLIGTLDGHTGAVKAVVCSADNRLVASCGQDRTVRLWDRATLQPLHTLHQHADVVASVAIDRTGMVLASGSWDHTIGVWDCARGTLLHVLHGHTQSVTWVAFSPDGQHLASASDDRTVRVWDVHTGNTIAILEGHTSWVRPVAFSPDGTLIASGGYDETIKLWDAATGRSVATLWPEGPYARMDITGVTGLTTAQQTALHDLGAVESGIATLRSV